MPLQLSEASKGGYYAPKTQVQDIKMATINQNGIISEKLSVGLYVPKGIVESILFARKGCYE